MRRRSRALPVALLATAALVWWLAFTGRRAPSAQPAGDGRAQPTATASAPARDASADSSTTAPRPLEPPGSARSASPLPVVANDEHRKPVPPDTRGFVDALEQRFAADAADPAARADELWLQGVFAASDSPEGLLRSISCRQTVCKLELHWTAANAAAYRAALDELGLATTKLVATRAGDPDESGAVPVTAFVARAARRAAAAR